MGDKGHVAPWGGLFVTGTDTGIGKTVVALGLMHALRASGREVLGMKPIATGCVATKEGLRSDDASALQAAGSRQVPYALVNPYSFAPAIAPQLAARAAAARIELRVIEAAHSELARGTDAVIIEGIGGWRVPINEDQEIGDLAGALGYPLLLVVGLRLGCINHALLTVESIERRGTPLSGWVANQIDPRYENGEGTIACLRNRIGAPLLGWVPWLPRPTGQRIGAYLRQGVNALVGPVSDVARCGKA